MSSAKLRPFCLGLNVFKECFGPSDVNQHINSVSIANALDSLIYLNCFMSMNSGMLFISLKIGDLVLTWPEISRHWQFTPGWLVNFKKL